MTEPGPVAISVVESRRDWRRFLEYPYVLYRDDPNWVAPLRLEQKAILSEAKHPFYQHAAMRCFLALSNGRVRGRIAAVFDRDFNRHRIEKVGTFGFYESEDSPEVAEALFAAAHNWLREQGAVILRGPMSPSINYECGLLVDGFDSPPCVMMTYNPAYFEGLFTACGLQKARDLYAYRITGVQAIAALGKLKRAGRILGHTPVQVRPAALDRFDEELERVWRIHSSAWSDNWGAAPRSLDEVRELGRQLKPVLIPELALFAEVGGETAGFGLIVPDMNRALKHAQGSLFPFGLLKILYHKSKIRTLRVLSIGVLQQYRHTGASALLYETLSRNATNLGYEEAECSWVLEDNRPMRRSLGFVGAEISKTYRVYEARIL